MKKYYIGLAVICMITLGFVGYVGYQGLSGKQDAETEKKAKEIAPKLNEYVSKNQKVPETLEEVGIKDVPNSIKYTKKSDSEYTFCVTYKTGSSYNFSDPVTAISGAALGGGLSSEYYDDFNYKDDYPAEKLYIYGTHKKGENCQTVKPYLGYDKYYENPYDPYYNDYNSTPSLKNNKNADDTERQTDIKALHGQIEAYYAQNGRYPTLSNMNSSTFRSQNMKGLDAEALTDPKGTSPTLVAAPVPKAYAYSVFASDGTTACDNTSSDCAVYVLTATLEDGVTFEKVNLN